MANGKECICELTLSSKELPEDELEETMRNILSSFPEVTEVRVRTGLKELGTQRTYCMRDNYLCPLVLPSKQDLAKLFKKYPPAWEQTGTYG